MVQMNPFVYKSLESGTGATEDNQDSLPSVLFWLCAHPVPSSGKQHMGVGERWDPAHGNLSLFSSRKLSGSSSKQRGPWLKRALCVGFVLAASGHKAQLRDLG